MAADTLPDIGEAVAPILVATAPERRPLLVALAERRAARRYREWAAAPDLARFRSDLLACAAREEEIAARVEGLYPAGAGEAIDAVSGAAVDRAGAGLFGGRPLADQLTIQARGERLGVATWQAFARNEPDAHRRDVLESCAPLEEESAVTLERILAAGL
jgi:hypothetical protein